MKHAQKQVFEQELIQSLCRYIEAHCDEKLTLAHLAQQAHLSPAHLQRRFLAVIGVSPKDYVAACRAKKFRADLRNASSVTEAVYSAGFSSMSRVYSKDGLLGMTPRQYREGGKDVQVSYATAETALGKLLMAATDRGVCFIQLGDDEQSMVQELEREYPNAVVQSMGGVYAVQFAAWMQALSDYLNGHRVPLDMPLDIRGTAFQRRVWNYLQRIPHGRVQSYAQVAEGIDSPKAVRAVASACARNNLAIVIPCHRVIRGTGELAGYRWGLARKRALIEMEKQ